MEFRKTESVLQGHFLVPEGLPGICACITGVLSCSGWVPGWDSRITGWSGDAVRRSKCTGFPDSRRRGRTYGGAHARVPGRDLRPAYRAPTASHGPRIRPANGDPVLVAHHHPSAYLVWSTTMPVIIRSPRSRPHGAPAYYLARPASVWITALHRRGTACQPERTTR